VIAQRRPDPDSQAGRFDRPDSSGGRLPVRALATAGMRDEEWPIHGTPAFAKPATSWLARERVEAMKAIWDRVKGPNIMASVRELRTDGGLAEAGPETASAPSSSAAPSRTAAPAGPCTTATAGCLTAHATQYAGPWQAPAAEVSARWRPKRGRDPASVSITIWGRQGGTSTLPQA